MMQAGENKSKPVFFDEAVYPTVKSRQLICNGLQPMTADH